CSCWNTAASSLRRSSCTATSASSSSSSAGKGTPSSSTSPEKFPRATSCMSGIVDECRSRSTAKPEAEEDESYAHEASRCGGGSRSCSDDRVGAGSPRVRGRVRCEQAGDVQGNGDHHGMGQPPCLAAHGREEAGWDRGEL